MASNKIKTKYKLFLKNFKIIPSNQLYQIIYIFLLALILKLFRLGDFPNGFHVDEVKVGWNAISLLQTLRDDKLNLLPLYYNTFGDYRPTGIFYFSAPFLALFGNTVFAVRFASALFGALTVFPIYFLSKELFKKEKNVGIYASLILAIIPWHIAVSRATSEVVISGFFVLTAIYFVVKNRIKPAILTALISYLLYHSARVLVPVYLLFGTFIKGFNKKYLIFAALLTLLFTFGSQSRERLKQVSIFNSENVKYELLKSDEPKVVVYTRTLIKEYGKYFSTDFLIGEARPYRYLTPGVGLINYIDLILLLSGTFLILKNKNGRFVLTLLMLSPLAAILTYEDSPNLHRSMYMVFFIAIIEGYALAQIRFKKIVYFILFAGLLYFLSLYFKQDLKLPYQKNLYIDSPTYRNIGNIELVEKLNVYKNTYDEIYVTSFPDNLYPWFAFVNKINPKHFNNETYKENSNERRYENIIFTDTRCPSDHAFTDSAKKILVVDSGECPTESKIKDGLKAKMINEVKRPDDSKVYLIFDNSN